MLHPTQASHSRSLAQNHALLSVHDLHLSLGQGEARVHILKGMSFEVQAGEAIALVGASGSGKSTLLMCLAGLERPDQGHILISDAAGKTQDITQLSEEALTQFRGRNIGIIFQSFHLIPTLTALENVALPLELAGSKDAVQRATEALADVGLHDRMQHFPTQLSGGEQQRVAIARALAPRPIFLVADEPTGSLDEENGTKITDLLLEIRRKHQMTLILVTHDLSLAEKLDRTITLRQGKIIA
jgi:putative ABC transport system ATP-binding protein